MTWDFVDEETGLRCVSGGEIIAKLALLTGEIVLFPFPF